LRTASNHHFYSEVASPRFAVSAIAWVTSAGTVRLNLASDAGGAIPDYFSVFGRNTIFERLTRRGGANAGGIDVVHKAAPN
jgi:hypothetical protein